MSTPRDIATGEACRTGESPFVASPGYASPSKPEKAPNRELSGVGGVLRALDLFCCAGGASKGLADAGFEVTGVDIVEQPHYPFTFIRGDALEQDLSGFDFVWASPPCQASSTLRHVTGRTYECLIAATRAKLEASGKPWIMENVKGAPLRNAAMLCGSAFGLGVRRHRLFESNVYLMTPGCLHGEQPEPLDVSGTGSRRKGDRLDGKGGNSRKPRNLAEARAAMGIEWMTRAELSQAIPPAYSHWLAMQFLRAAGVALKPSAADARYSKVI